MSLVSLFSDERGFLASDQLVYTAKELHQVQDAATMAAELASAIKDQTQINVAAKSAGLAPGMKKASSRQVPRLPRSCNEIYSNCSGLTNAMYQRKRLLVQHSQSI